MNWCINCGQYQCDCNILNSISFATAFYLQDTSVCSLPRLKSSWTAPRNAMKRRCRMSAFVFSLCALFKKTLPVLMRGRSGAKLHRWMRSSSCCPAYGTHVCSQCAKAIRSRRSRAPHAKCALMNISAWTRRSNRIKRPRGIEKCTHSTRRAEKAK